MNSKPSRLDLWKCMLIHCCTKNSYDAWTGIHTCMYTLTILRKL